VAKLTASTVRAKLKVPGKYGDGDGLWLEVGAHERGSWFLRYGSRAKPRQMSLGSIQLISLVEARERAAAARKLIADGVDPLEQRRQQERADQVAQARATTFEEAAGAYIAAHEAGWRSPVHRRQWKHTLGAYAFPIIGSLAVGEVATEHVLEVLRPIWNRYPETASRLRGRIEVILSYAKARGWREGLNPAVWRGHLQIMLPAPGKVRAVRHHAALDWREAPAFMMALRQQGSFGAAALEFAILTAARSGEVRGARWTEIDMQASLWTIPGERMKAGVAHRVPLSQAAMQILRRMADLKNGSGLVFLGQKYKVSMSDMTLGAVLRRMGRGDLTVHGFRSTFRDWAAEATHCAQEVAEQALAHVVGDKVEAAYRRGDLFEKRAALMRDWAAFLARPPAKVVRFQRATTQVEASPRAISTIPTFSSGRSTRRLCFAASRTESASTIRSIGRT